jgi:hypothetical protein
MNFSKINNYQKTVILWGIVSFVGFIFSQILPFMSEINPILGDLRLSLFGWLIITATALFFQVKWMWYNNIASVCSQVTWIIIGIGGWVLTYFKLYGYILLEYKATSLWLALCAIGMVFTAWFYKNNLSYYLLAILYILFAGIIEFSKIPFELFVTGFIFLGLGFLDAYLEHSKWRKDFAE